MAKKSEKTTRFVGLLRGINVGGKNKIKMLELRDVLTDAGLENVRTYIQSGNLIFDSSQDAPYLESVLKRVIQQAFACDVPVLARTLKQFKKVVADNPFQHVDQTKLHATMLASKPATKWLAAIDQMSFGDDQFQVVGSTVYVFCPNGYGRTKLHNGFFETKLKAQATTRNWKTVHKLIELANEA